MLTEDYCSYEVAKLLKEKGFNENTICKYANVGGITERWYDHYVKLSVRLSKDNIEMTMFYAGMADVLYDMIKDIEQ